MNKIYHLQNGLRIAYTFNPNVRSVCWGVFVNVGSAYETADNSGISHLIEHMCFKGTDKRSAYDIVRETEDLGANINAFTSKQMTVYYVQCVDDVVEPCVEILADVVLHPTFDQAELEKEKQVVIEEIAMSEDTPDDLAGDLAAQAFWGESSFARPILGTVDNVNRFSREDLTAYVRQHYVAQRVVLSVVGNISESEVLRLSQKYFDFAQSTPAEGLVTYPHGDKQCFKQKDVEQCNVVLSFNGLPSYDEDSDALSVLDAVLGGGMSSILFQRVREQLGLVYSIYGYASSYINDGSYNIYLGTTPAKLPKAMQTVAEVITELKEKGITEEQMLRGRTQTLGSYVFATESSMAIMRVQARRLMYLNQPFDLDVEIDKLKKVTLEQVNGLIKRIFAKAPAVGLVAKKYADCKGVFDGK
jgi:predicted Zn-dependent peptidase